MWGGGEESSEEEYSKNDESIQKKIDLQIPLVPAYILGSHGTKFLLSEFSNKELLDIGRRWTEKLIEKSRLPFEPEYITRPHNGGHHSLSI